MDNAGMESIVNCPRCKSEVRVFFTSMEGEVMKFARGISKSLGLGIDESDRFMAEGTCKCGKQIVVSMTITAM